MESNQMKQEIQEAIYAGERALASLEAAQKELQSARNWGIYDMLGGGFFGTMIKHSKINSASDCLQEAQTHLRAFQRELQDVQGIGEIHIEIGDFLTFADYFFDGLIVDYMVQAKINEARSQAEQAIVYVTRLLDELHRAQSGLQ